MPRLLSVFISLFLLDPVSAADIVGNDTYKRDRSVQLEATDVKPTTGVLWDVLPPAGVDPADIEFISPLSEAKLRFVAPPGKYLVELLTFDVEAGKAPVIGRRKKTIEIVDKTAPAPTPKPDPKPGPKPEPDPDDGTADPALTAKFKAALAADLADTDGTAKKEHLEALGKVYRSTVDILEFPDPAARPKTWNEVVDGMATASRLSGVPPPPEFTKLRTEIGAEVGTYAFKTPVDAAFVATLKAKFLKISAALQAAAK